MPISNSDASSTTRTKINVALFSGGSGTHSITNSLLQHPQIQLSIIINAYDDGHSTGRLRKFIPGMLGPSDVRKNIARLMPTKERGQQALKTLSDLRLPVGISRDDALAVVSSLVSGEGLRTDDPIGSAYSLLSVFHARQLRTYLDLFLRYFHEQEILGRSFDFTDCALGNLLFAGCYLEQDRDFNRTIRAFSQFYEVDPSILLNVTHGENLFLVARKEDQALLLNEGDIVATQSSARITELFLIDEPTYRSSLENPGSATTEELERLIRASAQTPRISPEATAAIAQADLIIFGPGTQHSSLFPSYMTAGVAEAIAANRRADKVFIGNIHRDLDIQQDDINDLARKFVAAMSRQGQIEANWSDLVTQFFVQATIKEADKAKYIPFDPARFPFPLETVRLRDWEAQEGRHSGGFVMDEIRLIVQSRIDIEIQQLHHMVSIVVPVLNEESTISEVLRQLSAMDFQDLGLAKEIIVVDGGSTDRSRELAAAIRNVKLVTVEGPRGRGAALRLGISHARGNIIAFFPADAEYEIQDLHTVIAALTESRYRAVFGTRSVKVTNLSSQLRGIYQGNWGLYLTSKYGGMLLSIVTLFLYNRYVSDILTSIKAFDAQLLQSLSLRCNGRDFDAEIVARLFRSQQFLLELPVDYSPRTRSQGKKITVSDGLSALWALIKYSF